MNRMIFKHPPYTGLFVLNTCLEQDEQDDNTKFHFKPPRVCQYSIAIPIQQVNVILKRKILLIYLFFLFQKHLDSRGAHYLRFWICTIVFSIPTTKHQNLKLPYILIFYFHSHNQMRVFCLNFTKTMSHFSNIDNPLNKILEE